MKKRAFVALLVVALLLFVGMVVRVAMKDNTQKRVEVSLTPSATSMPCIEVDTDLFWALYAETFPKDSLTKAFPENTKDSFSARLEITDEAWNEIRKKLLESENWCYQNSTRTVENPYSTGKQLFSEEEAAKFFEGWFRFREALVPGRRTVQEWFEVMRGTDGRIVVYYRCYVY